MRKTKGFTKIAAISIAKSIATTTESSNIFSQVLLFVAPLKGVAFKWFLKEQSTMLLNRSIHYLFITFIFITLMQYLITFNSLKFNSIDLSMRLIILAPFSQVKCVKQGIQDYTVRHYILL